MSVTVDYYFSLISPWAFLGHDALRDLARRHDIAVRYLPVNLGKVFPETGGLPLAKRHPSRQAHRFVELQRWREKRGVPLVLQPAHFPTDPTLADSTAIVLGAESHDVGEFAARTFRACWMLDKQIADEGVVAEILEDIGLPSTVILDRAKSDATARSYKANSDQAIEAGVYGSPTYVLNGEPFFGQDRLELLEEAIVSGRGPYTMP